MAGKTDEKRILGWVRGTFLLILAIFIYIYFFRQSPNNPNCSRTERGASTSKVILSVPIPGPAPAPKPAIKGHPTLRIFPEFASVRLARSIFHISDASEWAKFRAFYDPDGPEGPEPETEVTFSARWESYSPGVAHMNSIGFWDRGVFASTHSGRTTIAATYQGLSSRSCLKTIP